MRLRPLCPLSRMHKTIELEELTMSELIHEFDEGPYELLQYSVKMKGGKAYIELNGGDLGRLPVEDLETVEELREALNRIEDELMEADRRKEEL